jgi:hypothetical protein
MFAVRNGEQGRALAADLLIACGLIALVVAGRLLPHAPNFTPIAASALFAGMVLRSRVLAFAVPVIAMLASDALIGFDDWRVSATVYGSVMLPVLYGLWARPLRRPVALAPLAVSSSLTLFVTSNFAVWAFSGMYAPDLGGLATCYVAALPFLKNAVAGDLLWCIALFGGLWLARAVTRRRDSAQPA